MAWVFLRPWKKAWCTARTYLMHTFDLRYAVAWQFSFVYPIPFTLKICSELTVLDCVSKSKYCYAIWMKRKLHTCGLICGSQKTGEWITNVKKHGSLYARWHFVLLLPKGFVGPLKKKVWWWNNELYIGHVNVFWFRIRFKLRWHQNPTNLFWVIWY